MKLYSGLHADLNRLLPQHISIDDIAHSLAMQCRFNGHTLRHYSVAQHSVLVSRALPSDISLEGLMHDAEETYTGDMIKDLKHSGDMYDFCRIGDGISRTIFQRFGLQDNEEVHKRIKVADNFVVEIEKKCLFKNPVSTVITPLPAEQAEREFLCRFTELFRLRNAA